MINRAELLLRINVILAKRYYVLENCFPRVYFCLRSLSIEAKQFKHYENYDTAHNENELAQNASDGIITIYKL